VRFKGSGNGRDTADSHRQNMAFTRGFCEAMRQTGGQAFPAQAFSGTSLSDTSLSDTSLPGTPLRQPPPADARAALSLFQRRTPVKSIE
jgi:hypothetical protein